MATEQSARTKSIMLRLDPELAERLQVVADVEGRSVSDVLREAVAKLIEQRRKDKRFIRLLEETLARECRGGPAQEAAVLLVGLVRRRVFGPRSAEVAVMAAVQLLALNRQEVGDLGSPAELRELVAGIAAGQLGADELVAWLAERLGPGAAPSRAARLLSRRLKNPRNPGDPRSADDRMEGEMFERFTNRARNVVKLAQTEARRLDHQQIGTEHVLLGLLGEPQGIGAQALVALGLSLDGVR